MSSGDVARRFCQGLIPCNRKFSTVISERPDAYGPFWIFTTIIVMMTIAGNLQQVIAHDMTGNPEPFTYSFAHILLSIGLIFGTGFGVPLILSMLMKCLGARPRFP